MDKDYRSLEHKIRDVIEASMNRNTDLRRKVVNVGRPDTAESNFDPKSKLAKQGEIKTKIIDEAGKCNMTEAGTDCPVHGLKECMHEEKKVEEAKDADAETEKKEPKKDSDKEDKKSKDGASKAEDEFTGGKTEVDFDPKTNDKVVVDSEDKPKKTKKVTKEETMMRSDNKFGLPQDLIDAVTEAMKRKPTEEELKGGQHKLDKNKNGKLDAHDFKLLRKEEVEQIDELKTDTVQSYRDKAFASKKAAVSKATAPGTPEDAEKQRTLQKRDKGVNIAWKKMIKSPEAKVHTTEEAEQIDEISAAKLGSYVKKARISKLDAKDDEDFEREMGAHATANKSLETQQKRKSGIYLAGKKMAGRAKVSATEEFEEINESVKDLDKHIADFSKGVKSSAAKNSTYKRGGGAIHNMKHVETDASHQQVFDHLKKMGYKKTSGYDPEPNKFTTNTNHDEMRTVGDPVHHPSGISAHVESEHGSKTKVHFTHNKLKEEAEQIDELTKKTLGKYVQSAFGDAAKKKAAGDDKGLKKREAGINLAGDKAFGFAKVNAKGVKKLPEEIELSAEEIARIEEIAKGL